MQNHLNKSFFFFFFFFFSNVAIFEVSANKIFCSLTLNKSYPIRHNYKLQVEDKADNLLTFFLDEMKIKFRPKKISLRRMRG